MQCGLIVSLAYTIQRVSQQIEQKVASIYCFDLLMAYTRLQWILQFMSEPCIRFLNCKPKKRGEIVLLPNEIINNEEK